MSSPRVHPDSAKSAKGMVFRLARVDSARLQVAAVAFGTTLQARLYGLLDVTNEKLRQGRLLIPYLRTERLFARPLVSTNAILLTERISLQSGSRSVWAWLRQRLGQNRIASGWSSQPAFGSRGPE